MRTVYRPRLRQLTLQLVRPNTPARLAVLTYDIICAEEFYIWIWIDLTMLYAAFNEQHKSIRLYVTAVCKPQLQSISYTDYKNFFLLLQDADCWAYVRRRKIRFNRSSAQNVDVFVLNMIRLPTYTFQSETT